MEDFLTKCEADDLLDSINAMGLSVEDISICEPLDLVSDLNITEKRAEKLIDSAKETTLFIKRKNAIQGTWKAVEDSLAEEATKLFYKRLFEEYPSVVPLFAKSDMDAQAEKLFRTISLAVSFLDNVEDLIPKLQELGRRHSLEFKSEPAHYDAVGECLIWTLKTGLGHAWTEEVADAWTWVYDVIAKTMSDAGEEALMARRKKCVKDTWKTVEDALDVKATKLFYDRLFEKYPAVVPLFSNADMDVQAEKLYKTVSLAVGYLDNVEELVPKLEALGARHALEWQAKRAHYDSVGECLLWTLETGLGEAWTEEVADGWTWVYGVLAKTMADAGDEALAKQNE